MLESEPETAPGIVRAGKNPALTAKPGKGQLGPRNASPVKARTRPRHSYSRPRHVRAGSGKGKLALAGPALTSLDQLGLVRVNID